jgi:ceroid-lipofuscinosis MFS transporter 7
MAGALLWANAYLLNLPSLYCAQLLMGFGTGSLGVTRSYVSEQTPPTERTSSLAYLTSLQYAGFAVTPVLGSGLIELGYLWSEYWSYALPAYTVFFSALCCVVALHAHFNDIDYQEIAGLSLELEHNCMILKAGDSESGKGFTASPRVVLDHTVVRTPLDEGATWTTVPNRLISVCTWLFMALNFITRGALAVYETLGSEILLDDCGVSQFKLGLLVGISGFVGTLQLIYIDEIYTRHFSDLFLILIGLLVICVAQLLVIRYYEHSTYSLNLFVISLLLVYGFGYPISNSAVLGSFSMLQTQVQHSSAQANFALVGSLARIGVPIAVGHIEGSISTGSFSVLLIVLSVCVIFVTLYAPSIEDITRPRLRWTSEGVVEGVGSDAIRVRPRGSTKWRKNFEANTASWDATNSSSSSSSDTNSIHGRNSPSTPATNSGSGSSHSSVSINSRSGSNSSTSDRSQSPFTPLSVSSVGDFFSSSASRIAPSFLGVALCNQTRIEQLGIVLVALGMLLVGVITVIANFHIGQTRAQ